MAAIAKWLEALGLEKYAPLFEQHEIDSQALQHLSEDDLRELGLPMGPRRKIMAARASPLPPHDATPPSSVPAGERRHLTVMFLDLVGSTNLSVRTDPEVLSPILQEFKKAVAAEVVQFGGTVAKYLGDGVLAYFGWPRAREDAAECSLHAAFGAVARIGQLHDASGRPLQCRVGIATGLVVVGEISGEGTAQEDSVAGETLNLAARLESIAEPNAVFVADSTRRMVGGLFQFESLGKRELRGFDEPVVVWRATGALQRTSRFAAVHASRSMLVGRDEELGVLSALWAKAQSGEGRAVLVLGEAGIGKSRLTEALHEKVRKDSYSYICLQCSQYHENNALYPVVQYILAATGIADQDSPALKFEKLSALLTTTRPPPERTLPVFADLLSIPPNAGYTPLDLPPVQRKAAIIAALSDWIAWVADLNPLLLVLEDAHWIDATTQDLMTRLIHGAAGVPILIAVTARPNFASPWSGRSQVSVVVLDRLSGGQCQALVEELALSHASVLALVEEIVAKSDGNPLFLEELTKAVIETNNSGVPDTLQDSLMARLDQLGSAKQLAQIASVLGRRFARPLLSRLTALPPEALDADLSQLIAAEVIYSIGRRSEGCYEFKHALMRDAAYASLLLARRRQLHESCARQLADGFPEVGDTEPELLAMHFAQAGRAEEACVYFAKAGDRAVSQSAYVEAINSYRAALDQNAALPERQDRDEYELPLLLKLGAALSVIRGPQHESVRETYERAKAIGKKLDRLDELFKATWGLWYHANLDRDHENAAREAEELVALSQRSTDDGHTLEALHCRWSSALFRGENSAAVSNSRRGSELYDSKRHHALSFTFGGHDPGVCANCVHGIASTLCGLPDMGATICNKGITLAEHLDHPPSISHALMNASISAVLSRNFDAAGRFAERLRLVAGRHNFPPQISVANYLQGWSEVNRGDVSVGRARMEAEFERVTTIGPMPLLHTALYAGVLQAHGRPAEALALLDRTLTRSRFPELGLYLPELHRIRGVCLLELDRPAEALAALARAGALADLQGAMLLKLRIATSLLGTVAADHGADSARVSLRDITASFREGLNLPDVLEAQALLG